MSVTFKIAGADLREVVVEPGGQRRVDVADLPLRIDREETDRRVIEEIDCVAQLDEEVFLPYTVARHIADGPGRPTRVGASLLQGSHAEAQPARLTALRPRHPHLFLQGPSFTGRLGEPVDRLRNLRIADEHALDRAHVIGVDRIHELEIGGVGVDEPAVLVGHHDSVRRGRRQRVEEGIARLAAGDPQDAGCAGKEREHADHGKRGEQRQNVGLRVGAPDEEQCDHRADQEQRDREHQSDAATPLPAPIDRPAILAHVLRRHACVLLCARFAARITSGPILTFASLCGGLSLANVKSAPLAKCVVARAPRKRRKRRFRPFSQWRTAPRSRIT